MAAALGYDTGVNAPGRCSSAFGNCTEGDSSTEPYIVTHNFLLSHAGAVHRYRTKYQVRDLSATNLVLLLQNTTVLFSMLTSVW